MVLFLLNVPDLECPVRSPPEAVLIDSLLSVDQYRGAEKATSSETDGKPAREIAEVAAATELILPKGSLRTISSVRQIHTHIQEKKLLYIIFLKTNLLFN